MLVGFPCAFCSAGVRKAKRLQGAVHWCARCCYSFGGGNKICDAILESRVAVVRLLPSASLPLVCGIVGGMDICCAAGARCGEGACCMYTPLVLDIVC
eukprot:2861526-Amphidinium_carterae.1